MPLGKPDREVSSKEGSVQAWSLDGGFFGHRWLVKVTHFTEDRELVQWGIANDEVTQDLEAWLPGAIGEGG